jgi:hypothetical protein
MNLSVAIDPTAHQSASWIANAQEEVFSTSA